MTEVSKIKNRLVSLDFFRGLVMFLLIAEFAHLFEVLMESGNAQLSAAMDFLFHHAKWEGLHFWDLVQPFFMFIVGVSIPLSYANRKKRGATEKAIRNHAFRRAFLLLLFGWGLYCIGPEKIVFQFDNVLAQLSFTYLISFLLLKQSSTVQIAMGFLCILISDLLYRFFPVVGFDQAFIAGENFGAWFNIFISGYEYGGHWAAFNALPTAAHTLWGVVAGKWLMDTTQQSEKLKRLLIAGLVALVLGYITTFFTPIIKRISTTSFVLLSGGWTFLALALCYWLIDVKQLIKKTLVFRVVGVNPLFIYLFASIGGGGLFLKIIRPFSNSIIGGFSPWVADLISGFAVLFGLWYLCYWLFKKQIFIKFNMRYSILTLLFGLLLLGCQPTEQSPKQSPNIIYILADDLGYGELGAYGQEKIKTPNLDRLAAEGMRFTQHYTGAPVCAPSRYMFLTGTHAGHAYIRGNYELGQFEDENEGGQMPIPETTPTLAKMLKKSGYQTAMVGKWGLGMNGTTGSPLLQGFDYYYGYLDQKQAHNYYPTHLWENDKPAPLNNNYFLVHSPIEKGSGRDAFDQFKGDDYAPDRMLGKALHFLDTTSVKKPFFLYYPSPIPHVSIQVPDSLLQQYEGQFEETPYYGNKGYTAHQTPRAAYAAMITHLDAEVGKIWEAVKARGQEDNTLILFTSDNGPTFAGGVEADYFNSAAGFRGLKMDVYEGGVRIPFIAYWKGKIQPGSVSELVSGHWDMYNTFAELSGQSQSSPDGISILPELLGKKGQQQHAYIYFEYPEKRGQIALRMGDWKGVKVDMKTNPNVAWELYSLKEDPKELNNLAAQHPEIVGQIDSIQRIAHRHPHIREWEFIDPKYKR